MIKTIGKTYFARAFLRTPGQSIRASINEGILGIGVFIGIFLMGGLELFHGGLSLFPAMGIVVSIIFTALLYKRTVRHMQGLEGEKYVRDEIEGLIRKDYEIINDIPANKFNVDFMVIGPSGVYVIEVKNPSKRKNDMIAYLDGTVYVGPKDVDVHSDNFRKCRRPLNHPDPVAQVKMTADWVKRLLESNGRKKVAKIIPVVLFPKFWVENFQGDVWIMNSRYFAMEVTRHPVILASSDISEFTAIVRAHIQGKMISDED